MCTTQIKNKVYYQKKILKQKPGEAPYIKNGHPNNIFFK